MFHHFSCDISQIELPKQFTNPFHYTPHPLCVEAAREVRQYLSSRTEWQAELSRGKMIGILVVRDKNNETGFLSAFSGNLGGTNRHSYFVPPVYDLLNPDGHFIAEESRINDINRQIKSLKDSEEYTISQLRLKQVNADADNAISKHKALMVKSKAVRDALRLNPDADNDAIIRESQWQKAELRRIKAYWKRQTDEATQAVSNIEHRITALKNNRRKMSAELQHWLFSQFVMLNAMGDKRDLCSIFAQTPQKEPPAGAGECAAPKLLQYAYKNGYQPLAMAEFWCGDSPHGVIRHDGCFYPACKGKCQPILSFMLQGLNVEANAHTVFTDNDDQCNPDIKDTDIKVLYNDEYIVVIDKPAGMLSVPGKISSTSLLDHIKALFPEATGPMAVHRLDMDTSGIVIFAKDKHTHKMLQQQFASRLIHKRYIAMLQGQPKCQSGEISLPLCPDFEHRPQQMMSFEHGKPATTKFRILQTFTTNSADLKPCDTDEHPDSCRKAHETISKVELQPLTGRTHQLRVHCAHTQGLNAPILGDPIYGKSSPLHPHRMFLHAESITFTHPITGATISIHSPSKW